MKKLKYRFMSEKSRFMQIQKDFMCPYDYHRPTFYCSGCDYYYLAFGEPNCLKLDIKYFVQYKEGF